MKDQSEERKCECKKIFEDTIIDSSLCEIHSKQETNKEDWEEELMQIIAFNFSLNQDNLKINRLLNDFISKTRQQAKAERDEEIVKMISQVPFPVSLNLEEYLQDLITSIKQNK